MTTCPSGVNYMHLIDHGRNHIEKTYKRPFKDRVARDFLSKVLSNSAYFKAIAILTQLVRPFRFLFSKKLSQMISLMPKKFPKKTLPNMKIYRAQKKKKPVARVALLTGCVQKVISQQINEATIRLLNRHGVEVVLPKKIECWFFKPPLGEKKYFSQRF